MHFATKPLFRVDPGWLFILAGLVVCAAGVILPAQNDLRSLQNQLEQLRSEEVHAYARLKAHSDFMDQVDRADPALVRRLAAAQLHMLPATDTPVLLVKAEASPVTAWIDNTVKTDIRPTQAAPISTLSTLANGPYRLWMFGGGIMSVFVGLLISPGPGRARRLRLPGALWSFALGRSMSSADAGSIIESKMVELPDDATLLETPDTSAALEGDQRSGGSADTGDEPALAEQPPLEGTPVDAAEPEKSGLTIETKLSPDLVAESAVSDDPPPDAALIDAAAEDTGEDPLNEADRRIADPSEM